MTRLAIVSISEISEMMHVSRQRVHTIINTDPRFPKKITPESMRSPGWDKASIESYIAGRGGTPTAKTSQPAAAASAASRVHVVGVAEIAEMMKVSPQTVIVTTKDPLFPAKITPESMRSPGWDRKDIEAYIAMRAAKQDALKTAGRPPAAGVRRYKLPPEVNASIERRIRQAGTFKEFMDLTDLSDNGLRQRLSGKTTWRQEELERIALRLGTTFEELTYSSA